jgi:hypothetical protein
MLSAIAFDKIGNLTQNKAQPGGFYKVEFAPIEYIQEIAPFNPITGTIAYINFKPGKDSFTAYITPGNRGFKEEQKTSEAGEYMEISVECFLPYESIATHLNINSLKYHKYVVVVYCPTPGNEEVWRIVGDLTNPAKFSHSYNSGGGIKNVPGTNISFTWQNEDKAPIFAFFWGTSIATGGDTGIGGGIID